MPWAAERIGRLAVVVLLAACTSNPPATPTPAPSAPVQPGQPYSAADILDAMRTSPRPDGVPAVLQTDAIASVVAATIWTFDGTPWDRIVISGTCAASCSVEVAGSRAGAAGEDVWTLAVEPSTADVSVESTALSALPPSVVADLDALARGLGTAQSLDGMPLTTAAWQPPPDGDRFALSYRSGGEEGSCAVDLMVDAVARTLVDERATGC